MTPPDAAASLVSLEGKVAMVTGGAGGIGSAVVDMLARTAAREFGNFGIRVNALAPGLIETAMTAALPTEILQRAVDETALGHVGQPEDVARAVLFLVSPLSRHVTGQVLRVDGGQLMA